jgi:beta-galactosidase
MIGIMKKTLFALVFMIGVMTVRAQKPQLGAEIWLEPGYSKEKIMDWARISSESGLKDIRIFIMWTHVEPALDQWDFEVYDYIFEACEKYDLKLQVTLNANQPAWHYGKEYWGSIHNHEIYKQAELQVPAEKYIRKVVERYKDSPALDYWWIMNEPYTPNDKEDPFKLEGFRAEMKSKYQTVEALNKAWNSNFGSFDEIENVDQIYNAEWAPAMAWYDWIGFCNQHLTNFQQWVVNKVQKYDTLHPFTTNPGAYLALYYRQEASEWQSFLDAFGVSIHPAWHFSFLTPDQYTMGIAASCELARSVADPKPYWISELSAGDDLYRYYPSSELIAQWTWTSIAQGAEKIIYWLLNYRTSGMQAGEWAMVNFQNEPTDRLLTAKDISVCLDSYSSFFEKAEPLDSDITILLSPESSLTYARKRMGSLHTQSAMGCYEALAERGIATKIEQTQDFKWSEASNQAVILSGMITLPTYLIDSVKTFLDHGNKLIVLGPTGFYNEYEDCQYMNFPLTDEFGAEPEEIRSIKDRFQLKSDNGKYEFEVAKIFVIVKNHSATPILMKDGYVAGVRNLRESSEVVWIPSGIDHGAWKYDNTALSKFLADELTQYSSSQQFNFAAKTNNISLQTMVNGKNYLTVITNGLDEANSVQLAGPTNIRAKLVFCTEESRKEFHLNRKTELAPHECIVILWE